MAAAGAGCRGEAVYGKGHVKRRLCTVAAADPELCTWSMLVSCKQTSLHGCSYLGGLLLIPGPDTRCLYCCVLLLLP